MPFYLSEYIGSGTRVDPFRPVGSDQPGWSAIDLRPDGGASLDGNGLGKCLLHTPESFKHSRVQKLGDDKLDSLSSLQRDKLTNKYRVDLAKPKLLRDIIATMMVRPHSDAWNPILPTPLRWEIWLGGLLWSAPRISGGSSDNFNRPNETLSSAGGWSKIGGNDFTIVSNELKSSGASDADSMYVYSGAAATVDQYAEVTTVGSVLIDGGPVVRGQAVSGLCGYLLSMGTQSVAKFMNGAFGSLAGALADYNSRIAPGDAVGVKAVGSTITAYEVGVGDFVDAPDNPVTDTAIPGTGGTGYGQPGIFLFERVFTYNDWKGGDLGTVAVAFPVVADADDGTGERVAATWAGIASGTFTGESTDTLWISKYFNTTYSHDMTCLEIDTSGLPDMATVVKATLKEYVISKQDAQNFGVVADYYHFGGEPTVAADWILTSDPSILASEDITPFASTAWNVMDVKELGGINKFGYTGIRLTLDAPATPTGDNHLEFAGSEHTTAPPFTLDLDYVLEGHWARDQARASETNVVDFPNDIKTGTLLLACESVDGGSASALPTDSRGNVWTLLRKVTTANNQDVAWWYAISKDAGPCTVTFTGSSFRGNVIAEFSTDLTGHDYARRGRYYISWPNQCRNRRYCVSKCNRERR